MIPGRGINRGSVITDKHTQNQLIKILWEEVCHGFVALYDQLLYFLEAALILDPLNDLYLVAFMFTVLKFKKNSTFGAKLGRSTEYILLLTNKNVGTRLASKPVGKEPRTDLYNIHNLQSKALQWFLVSVNFRFIPCWSTRSITNTGPMQ